MTSNLMCSGVLAAQDSCHASWGRPCNRPNRGRVSVRVRVRDGDIVRGRVMVRLRLGVDVDLRSASDIV